MWYILDYGIYFGNWFRKHSDLKDAVFEPPSRYADAIEWAVTWIGRMNQFFPIMEAGYMIGLFIVFILFFLGAKLVLKLIPGIG